MTKGPGGRIQRRLPDMDLTQPEATYRPPPEASCKIYDRGAEITDTDSLRIRLCVYKGKIVDFAITQLTVEEGQERQVARIDCCRGTIHRHQFDRAGTDKYDHRLIQRIPSADGWAVVDAGYREASKVMFNEWEQNLRRWRGER